MGSSRRTKRRYRKGWDKRPKDDRLASMSGDEAMRIVMALRRDPERALQFAKDWLTLRGYPLL